MTSNQVPLWVPIMVGILGIVGVVAGQAVNAWRERRNEDLRWHRELKKYWLDRKIEVYGEFLSSLHLLVEIGTPLLFDKFTKETPLRITRGIELMSRLEGKLGEIHLIGEEEFAGLGELAVLHYRIILEHAQDAIDGGKSCIESIEVDDPQKFRDDNYKVYFRACDAARAELPHVGPMFRYDEIHAEILRLARSANVQ